MAGPSVYIETTIVSYLTSRPSRDLVIAAQQALTRQWWEQERQGNRLFISPYVLEEAAGGAPDLAAARLNVLRDLEMLAITPGVENLAEGLCDALNIPVRARLDAFHLAYAMAFEMDYLLTWNCAHLANAHNLRRLADFAQRETLWLPIVCTPAEMIATEETE
jgi:hypothetical protein